MRNKAQESTGTSTVDLAASGTERLESLAPWPFYEQDELDAAVKVLQSGRVNYWTGEECCQFESEFAGYHGMDYAIALANGTLALELGLRVLGIGTGDEVIVTPRSYFASASAIALLGAKPVFADVDPTSQNITVASVESVITRRTKAIVAVHLAGWPCEMPQIMDVARRRGLLVIEDCAQAHGASIDGARVGTFGDVAAYSFCQDKIMSTGGEGGMLLTRDEKLWHTAWSFKDHGKSWNRVHASDHAPGFRWLHETVGSNFRMTEVQGAIGRLQLQKLDEWISRRRDNARTLNNAFSDIPAIRRTEPPENIGHAYYKYYAFVRPERFRRGWNRDRVLTALQEAGVSGLSGSCPEIYREKAFEAQNYPTLPVAKKLGDTSMMLPVHPTLRDVHLNQMISAVRTVFEVASA